MKTVLFTLALIAAYTGAVKAAEFVSEKAVMPSEVNSPVYILTDKETGCQYITMVGFGTSKSYSITPRMGPDHQQICKPTQTTK